MIAQRDMTGSFNDAATPRGGLILLGDLLLLSCP